MDVIGKTPDNDPILKKGSKHRIIQGSENIKGKQCLILKNMQQVLANCLDSSLR